MKKKLLILLSMTLMLTACSSGTETITKVEKTTTAAEQVTVKEAEAQEISPQETESIEETVTEAETVEVVSLDEQIILDQDGMKITVTGMESDGSFLGSEIKFLIENESDKNITVQVRNTSVNGYMVDTTMSSDVVAGKKANDSMTIMSSSLEECGIEKIATVDFSFHIYDSDKWGTILDTEIISLETSHAATYTQTYDDSGELVYEDDRVKIISKGLMDDSIWGPSLKFYIENNSNENLTIQTRDTSVNGFMLNPIMSVDVCAGKKAIDAMIFMSSEIEENQIEIFEVLETSFHIFNDDNWSSGVDTDVITITFD